MYPVWIEINSCAYASPKSYGVRKESTQHIKVGTSASNSHDFAKVSMTHSEDENGDRKYTLWVDGQVIKMAVLKKGEDVLEWIAPQVKTNYND